MFLVLHFCVIIDSETLRAYESQLMNNQLARIGVERGPYNILSEDVS